jgi:hypothetical protein
LVTEVRIYFEGDKRLREGFAKFLEAIVAKCRTHRVRFDLIACGSTPKRDYEIGRSKHANAWNILLKDTEGLKPPAPSQDDQFWMVELMEAWFLADPDAVEKYYGDDAFNMGALKKNPQVEQIPKTDVMSPLNEATRKTSKGAYHKTKHAPPILQRIDPAKVRKAAPNCERLFAMVLNRLP